MPGNLTMDQFNQAVKEGLLAGKLHTDQAFISWTLNDVSQARGVTATERSYYAGKIDALLSTLNPLTGRFDVSAFANVIAELAAKFSPRANREIMAHREFLKDERLFPRLQIEPIPPYNRDEPPGIKGHAVATDEEMEAAAPASMTISHDITAENTNGMDESLGFNTDTGQHTVSTPGLTGATGVLGSFNFDTGMYNGFGPGSTSGPSGNGPSASAGNGTGPGAGGVQAP